MNVVYFLQRANGDIKIGCTRQFQSRISAIRAESRRKQGGDITVLGVIETSEHYELEYELHQRFAKYRLRVEGVWQCEWFKPAEELLDFIRSNAMSLPPRTSKLTRVPHNWRNPEKIFALVTTLKSELHETDFQKMLRGRLHHSLNCNVAEFLEKRGYDVQRGDQRPNAKDKK